MRLARLLLLPFAISGALTAALPVAAQQQSESYKFLEAIRNAKGDDVLAILNKPGTRIIDTRDRSTGEGALHIVAKRGDATYTRFLLQQGADANLRDARGNTPLLAAVNAGAEPIVSILLTAKADPNLANASGETPLILAVQRRDITMVRELLTAGANPDQTDNVAGQSARDYAHADQRSPAIAKVIDETPKKTKRQVAGPKF